MLPYTAWDALDVMRASHGLRESPSRRRAERTDASTPSPPVTPEPPDEPGNGLPSRHIGLRSLLTPNRPCPGSASPQFGGVGSPG